MTFRRARLCLLLSLVCAARALPLGASAGLRGEASHGDYVLNLRPPEEDARDVEASLDAVMKAERAKQRESDVAYNAEKARMLAVEKSELEAIVREAFQPLLARRMGFGSGGSPRPSGFLTTGAARSSLSQQAQSWDEPLLRGALVSSTDLADIASAAKAAATEVEGADWALDGRSSCTCSSRTYTEQCPVDWTESADGRCEPPAAYTGLCAKPLSFVAAEARTKMEAESICAVCWPCASTQAEAEVHGDGAASALLVFGSKRARSGLASGLREAPAGESVVREQLLRAQQKFSAAYNRAVPDRERSAEAELHAAVTSAEPRAVAPGEQCQPDMSGCPKGWETVGGLCIAGGGYGGPCAKQLDLSSLGAGEKAALARVCGLAFPCSAAGI